MLSSVAAKRVVGIVAILVGLLVIVLGVTKPQPFADKYTYWAEFDSAQGLGQIDRDVRIAGVRVGTIGEVEREGDDVRVELILSEDHVLHSDARVDMRPHTLFEGSNFVDVSPGSPSAPVLEEGETIPISQTTNYVTLDEALRVLRPEIRSSLQDLAEVGSKTLKGDAIDGVQRTLKGAPELTKALAPAVRAAQGSTRTELAGAIQGFSETLDEVAEREEDLIPLVRRASVTAGALATDGAAPLDEALVALPGALRELRATAPVATGLVDRLDRLAEAITPALPDLALAARDAVPIVERAIPVLVRATPLIRDTRQLAARLGKARGGLLQMFALLPEPLKKFDEAFEVINSTTVHGAPAYLQLLAAFVGLDGVFSGYQTQAQNPAAPGHALRVSTYFSPDAFEGDFDPLPRDATGAAQTSSIACADVQKVSRSAARELRANGECE
ncbi:MAG: MlaD family protein [Actinomycetota bacterium]|nr:MlaD family protein [Actinomycetota bacterium]